MAAHVFSSPIVANDVWFMAPVFDPGAAAGGFNPVAGKYPQSLTHVDTAIEAAERLTNRELWGEMAGQAAALMTAHLLWLDAQTNLIDLGAGLGAGGPDGGFAGVITSMSAGPVSVSFGAKAGGFVAGGDSVFADDALATTPFGKRLILMMQGLNARAVF